MDHHNKQFKIDNQKFFFESSLQKVLYILVHRPIAVIIFSIVVTSFFAYNIPKLTVDTSVYDLVLEDLPATKQYNSFKTVFGSDEIIRIVIKAENIFSSETFTEIERISKSASKIPGIKRVISLPEIKSNIDPQGKWTPGEFKALISPVKVFHDYLIAKNDKTTSLTLVLEDTIEKKKIIKAVRELMAESKDNISLYQTGIPLVSEALAEYSEKDFKTIALVSILVIGILLFLLLRNLVLFMAPIITVILSQVWTIGLMAFTGVSLSMLTMIVPVFLIAVGTAYCLHICAGYLQEAENTKSSRDAVIETFKNLSLPTILAVSTAVIGIGSLMINRITAIREFALFSCFGMISLLIIIHTLFPVLLSIFPLPDARVERKTDKLIKKFLKKLIELNINHQKIGLSIIAVLTVFSLIGIFRIKVETNPVGYFKKDTPIARNFHDIYKNLSGSFPVNLVMKGGLEYYFEDLENVKKLTKLQKMLNTLHGVDKTISFADYLMLVNFALNNYDEKYYALPEEAFELRMLINNFKIMLGNDMLQRFMNPDFTSANILLLTHLSSSSEFLELKKNILNKVKNNFPDGVMWDVTGLGIVISESSTLITSGQVKSLSLTIALILLIMTILFLSTKVGLIAILPNLFPIIVCFGFMGWTGIHLSIATSLIAAIAIGLAVDDTIHYLIRYNNEFKKDLDKDRALKDTVMHVGKPIIYTTLIIGIGFSVLTLSHFNPTTLFGVLMMITMLSALIADLILLPSLMLHVELITAWDLLKLIPTLGSIPPGVVHELNQPLNAIKVGSEFVKMMVKQKSKINEEQLAFVAEEISTQVDRASLIINSIGELGYKPELEKEKINLNDPIKRTLTIISNQLKLNNIDLETEYANNLLPVTANTAQIARVIFNIVSNAMEAISEKEKKGIDFKREIRVRTFMENKKAVIEISDSGIGVPDNYIDRIFEPFFTTKQQGKGKGLGLPISNQIVREYGGHIKVSNIKENGASFKLIFPVYPDSRD